MSATKKVTSLTDIKKARQIVATAPSGNVYRIRPMNLERYALAGGLPAQLREIALKGADGINEVLGGDQETIESHGTAVRDYMDGLVRQVIVDPDLADLDLDELPPVDYRWAASIALGEEDRDGEGRRLWGHEPLSAFETFRAEHGCTEDCESCHRVVGAMAEAR
jgi:hypothetical protein